MVAEVMNSQEDHSISKPWRVPHDAWDKWEDAKDTWHGKLSLWQKLWYMGANMNTVKYWAVLSVCFALGFWYKSYLVFFSANVAIFIAIEYLYYFGELEFYDLDTLIATHYTCSTLLLNKGVAAGLDYGFCMHNGKFDKKPHEAQSDKFDFVWNKFGLEPGMTVVDIGCGCGDWLAYLKRRGVKGYGINMTALQVDECLHRGLDVECHNIKHFEGNERLEKKFYGIADAVTYWDTIEHYTSAATSMDIAACDDIYSMCFRIARKMLNPESKIQMVWNSALHQKNPGDLGNYRRSVWDMFLVALKKGLAWKMFVCYMVERLHGGSYVSAERDSLNLNAQRNGFELTFRQEMTFDYLMTSYVDPDHFGEHRTAWDWDKVCVAFGLLVTCHNWWIFYVWYHFGLWLYQFDDEEEVSSIIQSFWSMWELKGVDRQALADAYEKKKMEKKLKN